MLDTDLVFPKHREKFDKNTRKYKSSLKFQSKEAKEAALDFVKFRSYVCRQATYPHMLEWIQELNTGKSNKYLKGIAGDDVCILCARNSAKSSVLSQWVAWIIGTHVNLGVSLKILYISYTVDVSASKSRQIKATIESELYQEVFPKVKPSQEKWGEKEWAIDYKFAGLREIDEPYTLACSGLKGSINSRRASIILCDDLLKSPSEARNKPIQDKMVENWNSVIKFTKYDGTRCINLGTRMAQHDIYTQIFVPPAWKVITQKALLVDEHGNERSFWEPETPESPGLSLKMLQRERKEDLESFLLMRQNEIPETASLGIREHFIKYAWLPSSFDRIVIGMDLASSVTGDYTAITVLGVTSDAIYVCDCYQAKMQGNMKKIDALYGMWEQRQGMCPNPAILAVDANKYAIDFRGDLEDYIAEMSDGFQSIHIEPIKSSGRGDKIDRLMSHSLLFEKDKVRFNQVCEMSNGDNVMDKLIRQITDYNLMDSNDLMDSLEVGLHVARKYLRGDLSVAG